MKGEDLVIRKKGDVFNRGDKVEVRDGETEEVYSEESKIFHVPSDHTQNWILWDTKKQVLYQIDKVVKFKKLDQNDETNRSIKK